ncbi:MAG: nickel-dependent hydrogenase large subunit [Candidatus Woesearchaeota archaeon]
MKKDVDISIQNISKIEGHADIAVRIRKNKVEDVKIKFTDNKRFFTQAIRKREIDTLPQSVARICGTCSIAHTMCCIEAIEKALGVRPSEQTLLLKKLTMYGMMIRDHALHVYLFSLPDVFGKDSVLNFDKKESKYLFDSLEIKRAGNKLSTLVAGRAVHAPFPLVGGYANIPKNDDLKAVIKDLKKARGKLFDVLDVYYDCKVDYTRNTNFVGLVAKQFDFLEGEIRSTSGMVVKEKDYFRYLHKVVMPYSQAVGYAFKGKTYMVGALARLNLNKQGLHKDTKRDAKKYLKLFPSNNIFHNNLAQGIEILHSIDQAIEIIESANFKPEEPKKIEFKDCEGVGLIEAPRGTLFYRLALSKKGIVKNGSIVVPTQQNQVNMRLDIRNLVQKNLKKLSKEELVYEMEKLVRAYDPCISCASHFLKVNWV